MIYVKALNLLLLLAFIANAEAAETTERESSLRHRKLAKKNGGGGGGSGGGGGGGGSGGGEGGEDRMLPDGSTVSRTGLIENHPCVPFSSNLVQTLSINIKSDAACVSNSCDEGACRIYSYLVCDKSNQYTQLSAACNINTYTHSLPIDVDPGADDGTDSGADDGTDSGADDKGDEGGGSNIPIAGDDSIADQCVSNFHGNHLGNSPDESIVLPVGLERGDCSSNSHCGGPSQPHVCCIKKICLCLRPKSEEDCYAS